MPFSKRFLRPIRFVAAALSLATSCPPQPPEAAAADGMLTLITRDDGNRTSVPARLELRTSTGRTTAVRRTIVTGPGAVLPGTLEMPLAKNQYLFRVVRGPEYRIVTGNFEIQPTAVGEKIVDLSRMVNMQAEGYLAGDMAALFPPGNLRLRMAAEDLHVAALVDPPPPPPSRPSFAEPLHATDKSLSEDEANLGPLWFSANPSSRDDLLVYPTIVENDQLGDPSAPSIPADKPPRDGANSSPKQIAIANPFSIQLPLHLANPNISGIFLMGDWLRESAPTVHLDKLSGVRPPGEIGFADARGPGRYAVAIYQRMLEAGLALVPLAGTGTRTTRADADWASAAIGYNRTYAIGSAKYEDDRRLKPIETQSQYFDAVWAGRSMITNGPLLRPTLGGFAPGHRFEARNGEILEMGVELHLAVRDPVDYLDVIHNGEVFYSARLDEFAKTGGMIPPIKFDKSGWVMVRVVTEHEEHFRAAISAPWFISFDNQPRISRKAVEFFGQWLNDCETELKKLPADELAAYIEPVRSARQFWRQRLEEANAP
jgi:hypothetical protein